MGVGGYFLIPVVINAGGVHGLLEILHRSSPLTNFIIILMLR